MSLTPDSDPIDQPQAIELHWKAIQEGLLPIWTVYWSPTDMPDKAVARPMFIGRTEPGAPESTMLVSRACLVADTVEAVRALLPPDLFRMPRTTEDEPQIVESWL